LQLPVDIGVIAQPVVQLLLFVHEVFIFHAGTRQKNIPVL
jgi:hypothetical protein